MRDQVELRAVDIDSLIGQDHPARAIWTYVAGLDLSELEDRVKARENTPGHPAPSPRLLVALWLYATSDGVGSARALDRLCDSHDVYRWICGGVSLNYHTLYGSRRHCERGRRMGGATSCTKPRQRRWERNPSAPPPEHDGFRFRSTHPTT
jgi:transposase